ncbi:MAG: LacI family DNA-binding transcriptional regulator [Capsulimonadales bacterium]|nr:LacI family DNA-binding transcriptional regulator [Capsulimonadales bacterium]
MDDRAGRITIKQIAETSGVSIGTVSRILGDKGGMHRSRTRERVLQAARELGYRTNTSARAMRSGSFRTVALLLSRTDGVRSLLPIPLLDSLHDVLAEQGQRLLVSRLPDEQLTDPTFVPDMLKVAAADGLLIKYDALIPPRLLELIAEYRIPAVRINSRHATDCVYPDDFRAGQEAVAQLVALGHRRIVYIDLISAITTGKSDHYSGPDRFQGYLYAMRAHSLPPVILSPDPPLPSPHHWREYLRHRLPEERKAGRITAVITYNGLLAETLLIAAADAGIRIPQDLSLLALGGGSVDHLGVSLTSLGIPYDEIGRQAVDMLLARIENPSLSLRPVAVPPCFIVGGTCLPVSSSSS